MQPDNLISLKDDMVAFIAGHGMRRLPAFITEEVPTVIFEEDNPDGWKDFVEHAKAAAAPFATMSEVVLEKKTSPSSSTSSATRHSPTKTPKRSTTPSISSTTSARSVIS